MIRFAFRPKFCISMVFNFSCDLQSPKEKLITMLIQCWRDNKEYYVIKYHNNFFFFEKSLKQAS